jgi:hypothetical protein
MRRHFTALLSILLLFCVAAVADHKLEKGVAIADGVPAHLKSVVDGQGIRVLNDTGKPYLELWFASKLNATAKPAEGDVLNPGVPEGTFVGVARLVAGGNDFRGQPMKPGVYAMRYALMPVDGNHVGAAPYRDFIVLVPADLDKDPAATVKYDDLMSLSRKASGSGHPAVFPLNTIEGTGDTAVAKNSEGHWVLTTKAGGTIPLALTVWGKTDH